MQKQSKPKNFRNLLLNLVLICLVLQGCEYPLVSDVDDVKTLSMKNSKPKDYEIWALDQGINLSRVHIFNSSLEETGVIDFPDLFSKGQISHPVTMPHMIQFYP